MATRNHHWPNSIGIVSWELVRIVAFVDDVKHHDHWALISAKSIHNLTTVHRWHWHWTEYPPGSQYPKSTTKSKIKKCNAYFIKSVHSWCLDSRTSQKYMHMFASLFGWEEFFPPVLVLVYQKTTPIRIGLQWYRYYEFRNIYYVDTWSTRT